MINTKLLMITSSIILGVFGLIITFLPQEFLEFLNIAHRSKIIILVQLLGAGYFAFAMLNWMAKDNVIGGVYSRPIAIGNFAHFFIGCLALIKVSIVGGSQLNIIWVAALVYIIFAFAFGIVIFSHPKTNKYSSPK